MEAVEISQATSAATVHSAQGRDYSSYQKPVQPSDLKGLSFAYTRFSDWRNYPNMAIDVDAVHNWNEMKAAGLHRGAYWFFQPSIDAVAQADFFFQALLNAGLLDGDMIVNDTETAAANVNQASYGFNNRIDAHIDTSKTYAINMIYSNHNVGQNLVSCTKWPYWFAHPAATWPTPDLLTPWTEATTPFWQWGTVGGVDADAFNGTSADLDAWILAQVHKAKPQPQPHGPYRHVADGTKSWAEIAKDRNTTSEFLMGVNQKMLGATDMRKLHQMAAGKVVEGTVYYTENP